MLRSVEMKDYMLENPATVSETDSVFVAVEKIIKEKLSGVCVVDAERTLLGILSEMDCIKAILSATYNNSAVGSVADYMTPKSSLITANINDDIVDIAADMVAKSHRRRPVIENGKLVGQITCRRLLQAMHEFNRKS